MNTLLMLSERLLARRPLVLLIGLLCLIAGYLTAPFDGLNELVPSWGELRSPVRVDALPPLGENQQVLIARWDGRAPEEVEEQLTYPLSVALLGTTGVKTVRSASTFGLSTLYVIFDDDQSQDEARARLIERLSSLPERALPDGVRPTLGPDATALGQVFWYTLEPYDPETSESVGGWPLEELRSIQDEAIRYALERVEGVAEVSPVGGYVREYTVESNPSLLERYQLTLEDLIRATRDAHLDVGAGVLELNGVEHLVRGVGQLEGARDIERAVVARRETTNGLGGDDVITLGDVARVELGPAPRRGALDIDGAEAVGGIVVARAGANPLEVIKRIKRAVELLTPSLPSRELEGGRRAQLRLRVVYDRSTLIGETLNTLTEALSQQLLITLIVVLALLGQATSALVMASALPFALALTFALMWAFEISANVMSLAGVAIAIGTMIDMGVVLTEGIQSKLESLSHDGEAQLTIKRRISAATEGLREVAPAVITSALTTIISFIPIFGLTEAEGKLFHPLAYTKTFALGCALLASLFILPALALTLLGRGSDQSLSRDLFESPRAVMRALVKLRVYLCILWRPALICAALFTLSKLWLIGSGGVAEVSSLERLGWVSAITLGALAPMVIFVRLYPALLSWSLRHKRLALIAPALMVIWGALSWRGAPESSPEWVRSSFPGLSSEFMPAFDEGEFIYMPTLPPHASMSEATRALRLLDAKIKAIPEVRQAVGKLGRAESALDPAPPSMFEVLVSYYPEYEINERGVRVRRWRPHIKSPSDIWREVIAVARAPGITSAPMLMPIQTRLVMLQSGLRAPLGLRLQGRDLTSLERAATTLEPIIRGTRGVAPATVFAERIVGKPHLELHLDRDALTRFGVTVATAQRHFSLALRGERAVTITRGRERVDVMVRADRGWRADLDALRALPIPLGLGESIPLSELGEIRFRRGPQVIKGEGGALVSYITFGGVDEASSEVARSDSDLMQRVLESVKLARASNRDVASALEGVQINPEGTYLSQLRGEARLSVLIPLALLLIVVVLSAQLRSWGTVLIVYAGVSVALSGAAVLLWCYGQPWFLNIDIAGVSLRDLFGVAPVRLSVAVWVGVIALLGVATDDGVVMASALDRRVKRRAPTTIEEARALTLEVGRARIVPCLITTATTLLALAPLLTSAGRGADLMRPMALPSVGGMAIELLTLFVVPVLYCARLERQVISSISPSTILSSD